MLLLFFTPFVLVWRGAVGSLRIIELWLLALPFAIGVVSEVLFRCSWRLAFNKGYCYDAEKREVSWLEAGERRTYKYAAEPGIGADGGPRVGFAESSPPDRRG